jgi:hypothetical protein
VIGHTGDQTDNNASFWNNTETTTLLGGHTGILPLGEDYAWWNSSGGGLHYFPFYKSMERTWGVRGFDHRWECDDFPNDGSKDTLHNIWARIAVEAKS